MLRWHTSSMSGSWLIATAARGMSAQTRCSWVMRLALISMTLHGNLTGYLQGQLQGLPAISVLLLEVEALILLHLLLEYCRCRSF